MQSQAAVQLSRQLARSTRLFSTSVRAMAAGDTGSGSSRTGGSAGGDAFTKRERGAEDMFVRQQEQEKLKALREKVKGQQDHLKELQKHIDDLMEESGGQGESHHNTK